MDKIVTFYEMEVAETTRLSEGQLEEDIEALEEECAYLIEILEEETRNKITVAREQQKADLVDEIAEIRDSWGRNDV